MKYYIISGEASGDLHASNLIRYLNQHDEEMDVRAFGGDLMKAQGVHIVKHYKELSFMGFWEVFKNLKTILRNLNFCKQDILNFHPDALILVDYPGFNMRIAKFAKSHQIPVYYYISPQVWAWKKNRVYDIKKYVRELYTILPFEKDFYEKYNCDVTYLGNPLLDAISTWKKEQESDHLVWKKSGRPLVAILPGSRSQELHKMLPKMIAVKNQFPQCDFVIEVVFNQTYALYNEADAALVNSGTATLETALFNVPQVVCYQTSWLSYKIAKLLVDVKYISLVNLIADKEVVKELIQKDLTVSNMVSELSSILSEEGSAKIKQSYKDLTVLLGGVGASERISNAIVSDLKSIVKSL